MKCIGKASLQQLIYVVMLAAHVSLVWSLAWLPTQDGPAHIYNLIILHDLLNGGKEWGSFFTCKLNAVPNLGFNLLSYPLLLFFPPLVVERIFVSLYILLMGICVPIFLKTFERAAFPLAYLVFPVIFNFTLLMGFYSYVIAVPFFILALSMAWKINEKSTICRFACLNLAGIAIFYVHLIAFLLFLISLYAIAMAEHTGAKAKIAGLARLSFMAAPCILQLILYLHNGKPIGVTDFSYLFSKERNIELARDLAYFSTVNYSPLQILPAKALLIAFLYFLLLFVLEKVRERRQPVPAGEKALFYLLSAMLTIYLLAPLHFGGGSFFNQRFPWVIFIVSLPLLRIPASSLLRRISVVAIISVAGTYFATNAFLMRQQSARVEKYVSGLSVGLPKGAFIMAYKTKDEWSRIDVLKHAASYYGIFAGCVDIGNYATGSDYFPVHFKHTLPSFPPPPRIDYQPDSIDWAEYPSIQYLIGWGVDEIEMTELCKSYRLIRLDRPLSIWQRTETARCAEIAISGNHAKLEGNRTRKEHHAQRSHTGL